MRQDTKQIIEGKTKAQLVAFLDMTLGVHDSFKKENKKLRAKVKRLQESKVTKDQYRYLVTQKNKLERSCESFNEDLKHWMDSYKSKNELYYEILKKYKDADGRASFRYDECVKLENELRDASDHAATLLKENRSMNAELEHLRTAHNYDEDTIKDMRKRLKADKRVSMFLISLLILSFLANIFMMFT